MKCNIPFTDSNIWVFFIQSGEKYPFFMVFLIKIEQFSSFLAPIRPHFRPLKPFMHFFIRRFFDAIFEILLKIYHPNRFNDLS